MLPGSVKLAFPPGFEPGLTERKSVVLGHYTTGTKILSLGGTSGIRTHTAAFTMPGADHYTMAPILKLIDTGT